jgi:quinol monooxygenase YgiN
MDPVRVLARATAREGKANELKALLRKMIMPTRAEQGCRYYELFESSVPGVFFFNELWHSKEDLDAHTESKHFTEVFDQAKELLQEPIELNYLSEVE